MVSGKTERREKLHTGGKTKDGKKDGQKKDGKKRRKNCCLLASGARSVLYGHATGHVTRHYPGVIGALPATLGTLPAPAQDGTNLHKYA